MNLTYPHVRIYNDMKTRLGLAILLLLLFGIVANGVGAGSKSAPAGRKFDPVRTVRVELVGLKPDRIEAARAAILSVRGVKDVQFLPEKREARVLLDVEKTNMKQLDLRIRKAGFTPWFH